MLLNWKTIDKLEAAVPGAKNSYKGEWCEFEVRLGRPQTPLRIDLGGEEPERFRIENKTLDISVEAATLHEAKELLRQKLAASEDFSGEWKLWMSVEVRGGQDTGHYGEESARCSIKVSYVVELSTGRGKQTRKRHQSMRGSLPVPFVGDFPVPTAHKELSRLQNGPAKRDRDEVWVEATPELVATIRLLQKRLGESGDKVRDALSKKRFLTTIEQVRAGTLMLTAGDTL